MAAKRKTLVQQVAEQVINYGGIAATRAQAYDHAFAACLSRIPADYPNRRQEAAKGAEQFAFGVRAKEVTKEFAARLIPWSTAVEHGIV